MKDKQIRQAIKRKLLAQYIKDPNALVVDELGVKHGTARIDIAVINTVLHGYEIKSDRDNLDRLPEQIQAYSSVFDRITLIVGYRHAYEALKMIPEWWGVKLIQVGKRGAIHFSEARTARKNPSPDAVALTQLLWKDEALQLLHEFESIDGLVHKQRKFIYKKISEVASIDQLRPRVLKQLKSRTNWRLDGPLLLNDG